MVFKDGPLNRGNPRSDGNTGLKLALLSLAALGIRHPNGMERADKKLL